MKIFHCIPESPSVCVYGKVLLAALIAVFFLGGFSVASAGGTGGFAYDADGVDPVELDSTSAVTDGTWVSMGRGPAGDLGIMAIAMDPSGNLYVGGHFKGIDGVAANNIAKWDGREWSALGSGLDRTVWSLAVIGGDVYAGGEFTTAGGEEAVGIAKWDGNEWSALGSGLENTSNWTARALTLAVSGRDLYVGGEFKTAGGQEANHVAKWDGSKWSVLGSGVTAGSVVMAMAVSGSDLYMGGSFTAVGGNEARNIAKWDGSEWMALGGGVDGQIGAMAVSGNDLYVGGRFTTAGGTEAQNIAMWSGSQWSSLVGGLEPPETVMRLAIIENSLYAGGFAGKAGGVRALKLAKWDGREWSALGNGWDSSVSALMASGGELYAGGFSVTDRRREPGGKANGISKWSGSDWVLLGLPERSGLDASVNALAVAGSDLYVGGGFSEAGQIGIAGVGKWDGSRWAPLGSGVNGRVYAMEVLGSDLYALGNFTIAGGIEAGGIARWDGRRWSALGSGLNGPALALAASGTELYVAGNFTVAGGKEVNNIAKWDGSNWFPVGSGLTSLTGEVWVHALAVSGGELYAAGEFTAAGGVEARNVARWDGSEWTALGSGLDQAGLVLAVMGNDVYAVSGGNLYGQGRPHDSSLPAASSLFEPPADGSGPPVSSILMWDGREWLTMDPGFKRPMDERFHPSNEPLVHALTASGNDLYVGGRFTITGGKATNSIAKWDGNEWSALGEGVDGRVHALAVLGDDLYVGGAFGRAGDTLSFYLTKAATGPAREAACDITK